MLEHYDSYNKDRCPDPVYVSSVVSTWRGITDISAGYDAIVGIKKDGTAVSANIKRDDDPIDISEWSSLVSVVIEGSDKEGSSIISEEALAEICNWSGIKTISINDSVYDRFAVGLKFNGTVIAAGSNEYGQCDVFSWKNIKSIITTANTTIGLRNDGTVAATGKNDNGQCEVDEWENIVSISANSTTTYGLKADGTVVAAGMQNSSISKLEGIVAIQARYSALYCLKSNGTVVLLYSDGNHSKPWDIGWTDIVFITCDEYSNLAGVKSDGTIVSYYGELTAIVGSEEDTIW